MLASAFIKGEIILDTQNDCWVQFIRHDSENVSVFDGLRYIERDLTEVEKAKLPVGLDALGFRLHENDKRGIKKYRRGRSVIDLIDGKYYIGGKEVNSTGEVQIAFNHFALITFNLLEKRILSHH